MLQQRVHRHHKEATQTTDEDQQTVNGWLGEDQRHEHYCEAHRDAKWQYRQRIFERHELAGNNAAHHRANGSDAHQDRCLIEA